MFIAQELGLFIRFFVWLQLVDRSKLDVYRFECLFFHSWILNFPKEAGRVDFFLGTWFGDVVVGRRVVIKVCKMTSFNIESKNFILYEKLILIFWSVYFIQMKMNVGHLIDICLICFENFLHEFYLCFNFFFFCTK